MEEQGQDKSSQPGADCDDPSVARGGGDDMSSSSYHEPEISGPQHHSVDSEDDNTNRRYRPHRTMFVSDQARLNKPPPSPTVFQGVLASGTTTRSSSHSSSSVSKRSPRQQRVFGDDTDPPNRSRRTGADTSFHSGDDSHSRSTDDSSYNSEIDFHSGHSSTISSRLSFESQSASTGSTAGRLRNENVKVSRKISRKGDIPPAFAAILKSNDSDNDTSSTGTPISRAKEKVRLDIDDDGGDGGTPITRNARRGRRKPKVFAPVPFPDGTAPPPPPEDGITSKMTKQKIGSGLSLPVNLVPINEDTEDIKVSTFNSILEEVASSEEPQVQKALNILATMKQRNITPDKRTWDLIELCAQFGGIGEESNAANTVTTGPSSDDTDDDYAVPQSFDLYSNSQSPLPAMNERNWEEIDRHRTSWKARQDLVQLPPAFRSKVMIMLRKESRRKNQNQSTLPSEGQPIFEKVKNRHTENKDNSGDLNSSFPSAEGRWSPKPLGKTHELKPLASGPPVSERKKRWSSKGKDTHTDTLMNIPIKKGSDHDTQEYDYEARKSEFQRHGVVKYERPDGSESVPRIKAKSILKIDQGDSYDIVKEIQKLDPKNLENFHALLQHLADSDYIDKAKQAGIVLKAMKEIPVFPNDVTRSLLAECSRIIEQPKERKVHEVDIEVIEEGIPGDNSKKHKKKVRFSEQNSTRIIRRRRSISSMERWDEPLTPPKRITNPVDLAPSRFSTGLRDHRPAPPRRSDSMSSLLSAGSASSAGSPSMASNESDTLDGTIDTVDSGAGEMFKPPFVDSPPGNVRKETTKNKHGTTSSVVVRRVGAGPRQPRPGSDLLPQTPAERKSSKKIESTNSEEVNNKHPLQKIPPPRPAAAPAEFTTPPSKPRPRIRRRGSIAGIEHRAPYPLTPPRRVSAPLDLFIAQTSLKSKSKPNASKARSGDTKAKELDMKKRDDLDAAEKSKKLEAKATKGKETNANQNKSKSPKKSSPQRITKDQLSGSSHSLPPRLYEMPKSHSSVPSNHALDNSIHSASSAALAKHSAPQSPGGSKISTSWKAIKLPRRGSKFASAETPKLKEATPRRGVRPKVTPPPGTGGQIKIASSDVSEGESDDGWRGVKPKTIRSPGAAAAAAGQMRRITSLDKVGMSRKTTGTLKGARSISHSNIKFATVKESAEGKKSKLGVTSGGHRGGKPRQPKPQKRSSAPEQRSSAP